jgi:hypothetical protein
LRLLFNFELIHFQFADRVYSACRGHVLTNGVLGVIGLKNILGAAAFAAAAFICGSAAQATTLNFTLQSDLYSYSWSMDSQPTVSALDVVPGTNTAVVDYVGQPNGLSLALPADGVLFFYHSSNGGGLSFYDTVAGLELFDVLGDQVYAGLETAPLFSVGTFLIPTDFNTKFDIHGVLTVAAVATTPIPAALPLFASAIGGLGFVGWRRKRVAA